MTKYELYMISGWPCLSGRLVDFCHLIFLLLSVAIHLSTRLIPSSSVCYYNTHSCTAMVSLQIKRSPGPIESSWERFVVTCETSHKLGFLMFLLLRWDLLCSNSITDRQHNTVFLKPDSVHLVCVTSGNTMCLYLRP